MKTTNPRSRRSVKWLILLVFLAAALYFYRGSLAEILEGIRALSFVQLIISCLIATVFFLIEGGIVYYMAHPFEALIIGERASGQPICVSSIAF